MADTYKQDDGYLFRMLANDSEWALVIIFNHHKNSMMHLIGHFIRNDEELMKEILSDVMLMVWDQRHTFADKEQPLTWMKHITRNVAISKYRQQKGIITETLDDHLDLPDSNLAESRLALNELKGLIQQAADSLPPAEREVFLMSRLEELTEKEIAATQGKTLRTVKNQLSRALVKVRRYLDKLGYIIIYWMLNL